MATIAEQLSHAIRVHHVGVPDAIAVLAAILSLLTLTLFLPAGIHVPW
ncbi:MAG TPA: hypothetical protein VG815_13400 [Chloroflexota bacterium]|jgi:hypothetical protein|nr:hypothetical protein [Chloroflexota bacterium]